MRLDGKSPEKEVIPGQEEESRGVAGGANKTQQLSRENEKQVLVSERLVIAACSGCQRTCLNPDLSACSMRKWLDRLTTRRAAGSMRVEKPWLFPLTWCFWHGTSGPPPGPLKPSSAARLSVMGSLAGGALFVHYFQLILSTTLLWGKSTPNTTNLTPPLLTTWLKQRLQLHTHKQSGLSENTLLVELPPSKSPLIVLPSSLLCCVYMCVCSFPHTLSSLEGTCQMSELRIGVIKLVVMIKAFTCHLFLLLKSN